MDFSSLDDYFYFKIFFSRSSWRRVIHYIGKVNTAKGKEIILGFHSPKCILNEKYTLNNFAPGRKYA